MFSSFRQWIIENLAEARSYTCVIVILLEGRALILYSYCRRGEVKHRAPQSSIEFFNRTNCHDGKKRDKHAII